MSLDLSPGEAVHPSDPPPPWGELTVPGTTPTVLRIALVDRTVSFPIAELRRWEHVRGIPETLLIRAGRDAIVVEGTDLGTICAALDFGRLGEIRCTPPRAKGRPGPQVRRISIEVKMPG
jgi:hypothetical protein